MFVSDIYQDLTTPEVLGTCDQDTIFKRLSDAVKLISNQGILDPSIGEMSLCVCDGCVTLPSEVETVLASTQAGFPTLLRDQWYSYHANGPGVTSFQTWGYTDIVGNVCTFKDPSNAVKLVAVTENAHDSNKPLRVYGSDINGKRIYSVGSDGVTLEDGFLVPTVFGYSVPNPAVPDIARIDRISKSPTNGFVKLIAVNDDGTPNTTIGYYRPEETDPNYTRIRVPCKNWLRIKYRKRNFDVKSTKDWVNVDNREALILAVKAVKYRRQNQVDLARSLELEAMRIISDEANAKKPPGLSAPQIIFNEGLPASENDTLFF